MKTKVFIAFVAGALTCFIVMQFVLPVISNICNKQSTSIINISSNEKTDPLTAFIPKELPNSKVIEQGIKDLVVLASKKRDWRKNKKINFDMHVSDDTFKLIIFKKNPIAPEQFCDIGGSGFCTNLDSTVESQKRYYAAILFARSQLDKI